LLSRQPDTTPQYTIGSLKGLWPARVSSTTFCAGCAGRDRNSPRPVPSSVPNRRTYGPATPRLPRHSHIASPRYTVSMKGGPTAGTLDRDQRSLRYYTNHSACALCTPCTTFVEARRPTNIPPCHPSFQPSAFPSIRPPNPLSVLPIHHSSCQPTFLPTHSSANRLVNVRPANSPSCLPMIRPSNPRSVMPTHRPTYREPTSLPTHRPTNPPVYQPLCQPPCQPLCPSIIPGRWPTILR
jgi:hypothetical protein